MQRRPIIVCLCGSTRFMEAFFAVGWTLTIGGQIVLSVGVSKHADENGHGAELLGQDIADRIDELHLRKIDLADWVLVLDVGGYIGKSTAAEIKYATKLGKPIEYLFYKRGESACRPSEPPSRSEYPSWETLCFATEKAMRDCESR